MRRNLIEYFKKNLMKGYTEESLKFALSNQGYPRTAIELSLEQAHKELAEKAPILKEKPTIIHEIVDENNVSFEIKKPWWKRVFGF